MASSSLPSVAEYYAEKNVFLTGATGFVGKVLIEKLLRGCPDISAVYCLVRPKKGMTGSDRLHDMMQSKCYDTLREQQPGFASKVRAVSGDILEQGFGISTEDRAMLQQCIHVVIHSAATVRFTEPLRMAMQQNVLAVRKMLDLCREFSKLEAYVHVSTAYANCDREYIEEKIYPPQIQPQKIIDAIEWMDDATVSALTPFLLHSLPNTYTLSKQLGEYMLQEEGGELPIAIVRPSIVTGAWREPVPGWVDNYNGPSGLYVAYGKGLLHSFKGDPASVADLIPVDFPVNCIISAGWQLGTSFLKNRAEEEALGASHVKNRAQAGYNGIKQTPSSISSTMNGGPLANHKENADLVSSECHAVMNGHASDNSGIIQSGHNNIEHCQAAKSTPKVLNNITQNGPHRTATRRKQPIRVYHMTSGRQNPNTWGEMHNTMSDHFRKYPLEAAWSRPAKQILTNNSALHNYWLLVSHLIPAYAADMFYTLIGRKRRMVDVYKRLHKSMSTLEYFTKHSWDWTHHNTDLLRAAMSPHDQKVFYLDIRKLHWPSYIEDYCLGTKQFVLKEDLSSLPAARAHIRKLRNLRYLFNTVLAVVMWRLLVARSQLAGNSWYFFMGLISKFVQFFRISSTLRTG